MVAFHLLEAFNLSSLQSPSEIRIQRCFDLFPPYTRSAVYYSAGLDSSLCNTGLATSRSLGSKEEGSRRTDSLLVKTINILSLPCALYTFQESLWLLEAACRCLTASTCRLHNQIEGRFRRIIDITTDKPLWQTQQVCLVESSPHQPSDLY